MKRKVELLTAGCPVCEEATRLLKELVCSRLPAVVVDGRIAECCTQRIDSE